MNTGMHDTIQLKALSIGYTEKGKERKHVARDINASLRSGELTCLLGANGAGKSTLLRTLSAFLPPLEGEVWLQGKPLDDYSTNERAKLIGVVLTEKPELHHMKVNELVGMGRSPYTNFWGNISKSDHAIIDKALEMVGMTEFANREVDTLSDGERQKVMIAKALAQDTPVIYLDEPTAFLDYPSKVETMLLLRQLAHDTGKTIFLSTHDVELALQTADTLWLMKRVRSDEYHPEAPHVAHSLSLVIGSPRELADNGALEHFFTGKDFTFDRQEMRFRIATSDELGEITKS